MINFSYLQQIRPVNRCNPRQKSCAITRQQQEKEIPGHLKKIRWKSAMSPPISYRSRHQMKIRQCPAPIRDLCLVALRETFALPKTSPSWGTQSKAQSTEQKNRWGRLQGVNNRVQLQHVSRKILSDLYEASEQSLMIQPNASKLSNRPMPSEIKNTIETLKFKKPVPQFFTRTEKRLFHTPGVYFAETKGSNQGEGVICAI